MCCSIRIGGEPNGTRTFLLIWFGQLVSVLGSGLTSFGVGVYIFQKTHSATAFSVTTLAYSLPLVLCTPFAGVLVDRWSRRRAMMVSDLGAGSCSLALALLVMAGRLQIWEIYVLIACSSAFASLMWPAFLASMTVLVPKRHLGRANGLLQGAEATSMILAPVLGATLMAFSGLRALVIADVASFVVSVSCLAVARVPAPAVRKESKSAEDFSFDQLSFGFRYILARRGLLTLLAFFFGVNLTAGVVTTLWTPLMLTVFNTATLARVMGCMGFGMLGGTVAMSIWGGPPKRVYGVLVPGVITGLGISAVCLPGGWIYYATVATLFMFCMPIMGGCSQAIWQVKVPPDLQGRVFAARRTIASCSAPMAMALAGPLADRLFNPGMMPGGRLAPIFGFVGAGPGAGIRVLFLLAGITVAAFAVGVLLSPRVRNVETELPDYSVLGDEVDAAAPVFLQATDS